MCECVTVTSFLAEYFCSMPAMMPASDSLRIAADIAGLAAAAAATAGGTFKFTSEVLMGLCSAVQEMTGAERAKPEEEDDESESGGWRES